MAHRPRGHVTLTGYSNRPEALSYFLSEMRTIRESKVLEPEEMDFSEIEEGSDPNAEWLKRAGLGSYVDILENTQGEDETIDSSAFKDLPQSHVRAIHKRMHTLRTTIRSRHGRETKKGSGNITQPDISKLPFGNGNHIDTTNGKSLDVQLLSVERRQSSPPPDSPPSSLSSSSYPAPRKQSSPHISRFPSRDALHTSSLTHNQTSSNYAISNSTENRKSASCNSSPVPSRRSTTPPTTSVSFSSPKRKSNGVLLDKGASSVLLPLATEPHSPSDMKLSVNFPSTHQLEHELPAISLDLDPLGMTEIGDLSPNDMEKIRCLAHIELSVTFEENNIPLRNLRHRKAAKINEEQLFGVPLSTLLQNDQKRNSKAMIPLLFKEMIEYLETNGLSEEGLLRVSGSKHRTKTIQDEIESSFNNGTFSFEGKKASDVSSLLKQFIRDLPVPLLTMENLPAFAMLADIADLKERLRTLNLLILMLPTLHQRVLKRLLLFCERIHMEREVTKMDINNISMVLAPNLFLYLPASKLSCDDVALAAKTSHVVMLLIKYHTILWTIPAGMLSQVRFLYELELKKVNERYIKQALQKMNPSLESPCRTARQLTPESSSYVIRVRTPLFTCHSKAVNIQENPTAAMVIAKLRKRSQINPSAVRRISLASIGDVSPNDDLLDELEEVNLEEQFLFEVGGNIGERRLAPNTNMLALYDVNPNASWVIKPRGYHETTPDYD